MKKISMRVSFDWNEENLDRLARHQIAPEEAEQVIQNRPLDLTTELRNGKERVAQVGETDTGRVLVVVSTAVLRSGIRVVTAWPAKERLRRYFKTQKEVGNAGRVEDQDL